jgi:hypothetical protein
MESKNRLVARRQAGGEETVELTLLGRKKRRRGDIFPPASVLIAEEREREGAVLEPPFLVDDGWASVSNLKLAQPKQPNGCTVVNLTRYQGLNKFQIELSCKMEKAYLCCSKNS